MLVTKIPTEFGSFLTCLKIQLFSTDLAAFTTAGAKTFLLTGNGIQNALSAVNSGNVTIPAGGCVLGARLHLVTSFTGGALSAVTLSVGKGGGSATYLLGASDVFTAGGDTVWYGETPLLKSGQQTAWNVNVTFTPTGDVLGNATAGEADLYLYFFNVSDPTA